MISVQLFVASFLGWLQHEQHEIILYLREENRVLKAQLRHRRLRLTDSDRRRLAALGERLGRRMLAQVARSVGLWDISPLVQRAEERAQDRVRSEWVFWLLSDAGPAHYYHFSSVTCRITRSQFKPRIFLIR